VGDDVYAALNLLGTLPRITVGSSCARRSVHRHQLQQKVLAGAFHTVINLNKTKPKSLSFKKHKRLTSSWGTSTTKDLKQWACKHKRFKPIRQGNRRRS